MLTCRRAVHSVLPLALALSLSGCVIEGSANPGVPSTPSPAIAPAITTQPASVTVPIGLQYTLTVSASGSPLNYQWALNGAPIAGATGTAYTIPTVSLADSGALYTVTVSNSAGTVKSQPAILTAGARAPKNGDLRFQQVDSANTVNGYVTGLLAPSDLPGRGSEVSSYAVGFLFNTFDSCSPVFGCVLFFTTFAQPAGAVPLAVGYVSDTFSNFQATLSTGVRPGGSLGGGPLNAVNTVVTSLQLDAADQIFGLSYTQTSQSGGFDLAQHTISPSLLPAAATQEGNSSRVITAISYNGSQITYFSYGWQQDTTTAYDTLTATATPATVGSVTSALAAQGYIITAFGGDATNGIVLVGTRVHGDNLPRPILIEPSFSAGTLQIVQQGYALVGVANNNSTGIGVTIGER